MGGGLPLLSADSLLFLAHIVDTHMLSRAIVDAGAVEVRYPESALLRESKWLPYTACATCADVSSGSSRTSANLL